MGRHSETCLNVYIRGVKLNILNVGSLRPTLTFIEKKILLQLQQRTFFIWTKSSFSSTPSIKKAKLNTIPKNNCIHIAHMQN